MSKTSTSTGSEHPGDDASSALSRQELRARLLARRNGLSTAAVTSNSHQIIQRLKPLLTEARFVAGYLAFGNEVNIERLLLDIQSDNSKSSYVPLVQTDHTLLFAPLDEQTRIHLNRYGIREPDTAPERCIGTDKLDTVLVPLLGFDDCGSRLGMGGGYYDRTFASSTIRRPRLIGVAHDIQRTRQRLESAWWDVPLDMVVTEAQIYRFDRRSPTD